VGEGVSSLAFFLDLTGAWLGAESPEAWTLLGKVRHLAQTEDEDLAWRAARVAFAIGTPQARRGPDLADVRERVAEALALETAKATRYVRIGDSTWTRYVLVAAWPSKEGDIAFLLPAPPIGSRYSFDRSLPAFSLGGKPVSWPGFDPPLVSDLVSGDPVRLARAGFIPEAIAVQGNASLPAAVTVSVRA